MLQRVMGNKPTWAAALIMLFVAGVSTATADQLTLSYIDYNAHAQTLSVDCNSSAEDLATAAGLLHELGVGVTHDPAAGCGTLAEIAAAMAAAAPVFAADIAQALVALSPADEDAIVAAINAVTGVNTTAVLAAVHLGPAQRIVVPPTEESDLPAIEPIPSRN